MKAAYFGAAAFINITSTTRTFNPGNLKIE